MGSVLHYPQAAPEGYQYYLFKCFGALTTSLCGEFGWPAHSPGNLPAESAGLHPGEDLLNSQ